MNQTVQKRSRREDNGRCGNPAAIEQFDSGDPILFKKDLHDLGLLDEEIRRLLDKAAHHVPIAGFVFLGARRPDRRPATRIE